MRIKALLIFALLSCSAFAADVYITQNTSGGDTGANCANAHSVSWFNTNASGTNTYHLCGTFTGVGNSGNVMLQPTHNGTDASNTMVIQFEAGADLTAPAWDATTGAIYINGRQFITIEGGSSCVSSTGVNCGVVENTDNGSSLTYLQASYGIVITGSSNVEVKHVAIKNIFQNNGDFVATPLNAANVGLTAAASSSTGIHMPSSAQNTLSIHDNYIDMVSIGIDYGYSGRNNNGLNIYSNTIRDMAWGVSTGASTALGANVTNAFIHDNDINGWLAFGCPMSSAFCFISGWSNTTTYPKNIAACYPVDCSGAKYTSLSNGNVGHQPDVSPAFWAAGATIPDIKHHDGIINSKGRGGDILTHLYIYNNKIAGNMQSGSTAGIFCTWGGGTTGYNNLECDIFNNTIDLPNAGVAIELSDCLGPTDQQILNNTLFGNQALAGLATQGSVIVADADSAGTRCLTGAGNPTDHSTFVSKNNIIEWGKSLISAANASGTGNSFAQTVSASDYNTYFNAFNYPAGRVFDSSDFKTWNVGGNPWTPTYDAHGQYVDPNINTTTYVPNVGSPVISAGVDLTALCSTLNANLCSDAGGSGRPNGSAWTIGARNAASAGPYLVTLEGLGNSNGKVCTDGTTCTDGILNAVMTAGVTTGTSTHSFTAGATATLTATATTGSFVTFSGGGCTTSPCTITVNSPLTITATFQTTPTCSLSFAANSLNSPAPASATTVLTQLSGPNSLWFIFGPPPDNAPIFNCQYPYSGCNANGQTGNIAYVGSGIYTLGACSNGLCCTASTQPLNVNTGAGSAAH